ncbi:uncharacterized protein LOC121380985 [Gigantopelta aegis]|uniref:uncharacterized protein LOC121380985 n=1 Tax=Gigantopelta aegis TaxID=1735272 RepID=UPI001B88853E|nr:uncharacterized protein LOC121380985 [Gigantopelta aegis]
MSFKREGNDKHLLNILRQRRIKDLLADDIPQDEATLLSNGRLACTVCSSRPVFDTVNMLTIHRHGKKHIASMLHKEREKQELKNLIIKRKHEQFLKDGTTNIQQASANHKGFGCSLPYDPRVKKHKLKPYDRKPTLNLSETYSAPTGLVSFLGMGTVPEVSHPENQFKEKTIIKNGNLSPHATDTVSGSTLPGNRDMKKCVTVPLEKKHAAKKKSVVQSKKSKLLEMITMQQEGPVKHSSQLSKIFKTPEDDKSTSIHVVDRPYRSKKDRQLVFHADSKTETIAFNKEHSLIKISLKKSIVNKNSFVPSGNVKKFQVKTDSCDDKLRTIPSCQQSGESQCQKTHLEESSASKKEEKTDHGKRWQLGGSGWKRDWDGKWIKEEEAEFDSDEEPPELL